MSDKPKKWWESQKVMVGLISGLAILTSVTVLIALGKIEFNGVLSPDTVVDALTWIAGFVIGGRALEGASAARANGRVQEAVIASAKPIKAPVPEEDDEE